MSVERVEQSRGLLGLLGVVFAESRKTDYIAYERTDPCSFWDVEEDCRWLPSVPHRGQQYSQATGLRAY